MYEDLTKDELRELQWIIFRGWQKALCVVARSSWSMDRQSRLFAAHDLEVLVKDIEVLL